MPHGHDARVNGVRAQHKSHLYSGPGLRVQDDVDVIALDDALTGLERLDQRKSQVVELGFFGGLTVNEIADVLNVSAATLTAIGPSRVRGFARV